MENFELLKEAYINGLEPRFKSLAYQMFNDGKSIEEIYRYISSMRHKNRGTIKITRPLTVEERKFLSQLPTDLRKKSFADLMKGTAFADVKQSAEKELSILKVKELKKAAIKQALKVVAEMQKVGVEIPQPYYEIIFDWDVLVPMDYDLFGKMALVMLGTYNEQGKGAHYQEVRSFMFAKIEECFERGIMPHPLMFDFMFKGGWISEKTFMVLHVYAQELIEAGMGAKLALPLQRMLENRRKDEDVHHPFSLREEHYFISLINLFQR